MFGAYHPLSAGLGLEPLRMIMPRATIQRYHFSEMYIFAGWLTSRIFPKDNAPSGLYTGRLAAGDFAWGLGGPDHFHSKRIAD